MKGREEDLVFSRSGNMPDWAAHAGQFWQTAEENARQTAVHTGKSG